MKFPEMMFYAEEEGLLPTWQGRLNAVAREFRMQFDPSMDSLNYILNKYNLPKYAALSEKEKKYLSLKLSK